MAIWVHGLNMIGRSMETYLHRPIKAPQFITPERIEKSLA